MQPKSAHVRKASNLSNPIHMATPKKKPAPKTQPIPPGKLAQALTKQANAGNVKTWGKQ